MRFLPILCLFFLQACVASHNINYETSAQNAQLALPLFPLAQAEITSEALQNMQNNNLGLMYKAPQFTKRAEQSFVYLALAEAVRKDDYEKVIESCQALLRIDPNPQMIGDACSWLLSNGYIQETQNILDEAVHIIPDDLSLHIMLSEAILLEDEENPRAIQTLEDYVKRHPKEYVAQMELALTYLKINSPQKAYDAFNNLPESEKTPMVLYYTGFSLQKLGRTNEAVHVLKRSLQKNPKFMESILELAQIEEERENYTLARQYYEHVLDFDVYNQDVLLHLVGISLKQGNPERAFEIAKSHADSFSFVVGASAMLMEEGRADLVEILLSELSQDENATRELIYLQGALAYEGLRNYDKALFFLNQITENDKHYKNSIDLKAQIFLEQGKFDDALLALNKALLHYPHDKGIQQLIYQIYLYKGEYALAYPLLQSYTSQYPEDFDASFKLAFVLAHLNKKKSALKLMKQLLEQDPDNHEILNFVGYSLVEEKRKLPYALELIKKANYISPHTDYILDSLAWAYYQMKEYEKAWTYIQEAIFYIKPNTAHDPSMWDHYGDIAYELGRFEQAKKGWERALQLTDDIQIEKKLKKMDKVPTTK